ncbi:MAG TPA: pyridoxal phosphate-dependent aminotransferase, partial [Williamwhitmania sp.]|nr:pyridoxal phosphate-dependent aminotransferase [Williamwhitmania sp.]
FTKPNSQLIMDIVSERLKKLSVSQTLAMSQKSKDLKAQGIDVIDLSVGEPDFNTPDHIKDAAKRAIDDNFTFYSPVPGFMDLRQAIAHKFKVENGLTYAPEQIVVSNGAKQSLTNVILSMVNPGEEVIVLAPYWVSYLELVKVAEGTPVVIKTTLENDFKVTLEQLRGAITPKSKLLILCSPSNPTGSIYSKQELHDIAVEVAKHPDLFIIADEIYEHINFVGRHESIAQFDFIYEKVITINGVSKGFAMTGWRIGYMAASKEIAQACIKLQGQTTSGASSIAQKAAFAALTIPSTFPATMNAAFKRRRDLVYSYVSKIDGVKVNLPEGAFYIFPDISSFFGRSYGDKKIQSAQDITLYLLEVAHIALVPGCAFGEPNCIRISYATSDEVLVIAMERFTMALKALTS